MGNFSRLGQVFRKWTFGTCWSSISTVWISVRMILALGYWAQVIFTDIG